MGMMLTKEYVDRLEAKILDDIGYREEGSDEDEEILVYIAGIRDMANAVRRAIKVFGGK